MKLKPNEKADSVTSRALKVLAAFEGTGGVLSVARIAKLSGLPLSTTYRLVHELESWGGLRKNHDGDYQIGMRIWELGQLAGRRLRDRAHPHLQDLFELTHENVHMAVREGLQSLYVDKVYGSRRVPKISRVGGRLPLHATAVGRVLLAAEPDWFIESYLSRELEAPTRKTTTSASELRSIIADVQTQGRSITVEQMRVGACSVAYPIIVGGNVVASVGLVIDATRQSEIARLVPLLTATCHRIEASLSTNIDAFI